jgi:hypothetical protein
VELYSGCCGFQNIDKIQWNTVPYTYVVSLLSEQVVCRYLMPSEQVVCRYLMPSEQFAAIQSRE